jgi:hypothetical protein
MSIYSTIIPAYLPTNKLPDSTTFSTSIAIANIAANSPVDHLPHYATNNTTSTSSIFTTS